MYNKNTIKTIALLIIGVIINMSIIIPSSKILERPEVNILNNNIYKDVVENSKLVEDNNYTILELNNVPVNVFPSAISYSISGDSMMLYSSDQSDYTEPQKEASNPDNQYDMFFWNAEDMVNQSVHTNMYTFEYEGDPYDIDNILKYGDIFLNVSIVAGYADYEQGSLPLLEKRRVNYSGYPTYIVESYAQIYNLIGEKSGVTIPSFTLFALRAGNNKILFYLYATNRWTNPNGRATYVVESFDIEIIGKKAILSPIPDTTNPSNAIPIMASEINQEGIYINNTESSFTYILANADRRDVWQTRPINLLSLNRGYSINPSTGAITFSDPITGTAQEIYNQIRWGRKYYMVGAGGSLAVVRLYTGTSPYNYYRVRYMEYDIIKQGIKDSYYDEIRSSISNEYSKGKATAKLKVAYSEYRDENDNIVYTGKDGKIIKVGDIIEPYYYAKTGYNPETYEETYEDVPLLTDASNDPKQFLVTGSEINAGKSIYVNLDVVEIT